MDVAAGACNAIRPRAQARCGLIRAVWAISSKEVDRMDIRRRQRQNTSSEELGDKFEMCKRSDSSDMGLLNVSRHNLEASIQGATRKVPDPQPHCAKRMILRT